MSYVCIDFQLARSDPGQPSCTFPAELAWVSADAAAVQLTVVDVPWLFARDLLADGLTGSVGIGDVRVRPCPADRTQLELTLNSPSGRCSLLADLMVVDMFLQSTCEHVARGSEVYELPEAYEWSVS